MQIKINSALRSVAPEWQDETLLNVLREHLGLVGSNLAVERRSVVLARFI
jgi:aerobic-type carbon monoxide dehydrogenase small subunit (CoxS/CutS family)